MIIDMKGSIDMPQKKHLMIFGAHCGDGELQAGAIAAKYANAGHTVTFLSLTAYFETSASELEAFEKMVAPYLLYDVQA